MTGKLYSCQLYAYSVLVLQVALKLFFLNLFEINRVKTVIDKASETITCC